MDQRTKLQQLFEILLGSRNVYFEPPANTKIVYPCIIYKQSGDIIKHASNKIYLKRKQYTVTVVSNDPLNPIKDLVAALPYCSFDRPYTSGNLHHSVYRLYF